MKRAYYRKIPAFYNPISHELKGRNKFYDVLVGINVFIDFKILKLEEIPILIEDDE